MVYFHLMVQIDDCGKITWLCPKQIGHSSGSGGGGGRGVRKGEAKFISPSIVKTTSLSSGADDSRETSQTESLKIVSLVIIIEMFGHQ